MKKIESILYIEDEENTLEHLSSVLKRFCDNLLLATNGEEGLELYKKSSPKLVITDINMPLMDGIQLAKKIKLIKDDAKIIFLTAFSDISLLQGAIEVQAEAYLMKPIDFDSLENALLKVNKNLLLEEELKEKRKIEIKQKEELETILSTTKDGISILDSNLRFLYANSAFIKMLGYSFEELQKLSTIDISAKEDKEKAYLALEEVLENGYKENYIKRYISKEGKEVYVNINASLMPDKKSILISTKNITQEVFTQRKLDEYIEIINKNVITSSTNLNREIIDVSDAFCNISGYLKDELIGNKHTLLSHPDTKKEFHDKIWGIISKNETWEGEVKNINKEGETYYLNSKIYPTLDKNGEKNGYMSISQDITNLKQVRELSIKDGLTNIYNRRFFNEIFPNYIKSAKRDNELISFIILDVDFFKKYNDTYGHQKGDEALIKITEVLNDVFKRADDYTFRLGGEEFGGLFKTKSKAQSLDFTKNICKKIKDLKIPHEHGIDKSVSVSIGLICIEANEISDENRLYQEVDEQLYFAKENGRNRVKSNLE